jgi:hypothetical protein
VWLVRAGYPAAHRLLGCPVIFGTIPPRLSQGGEQAVTRNHAAIKNQAAVSTLGKLDGILIAVAENRDTILSSVSING